MSELLISRYYAELEKIKRYSGATNETSLRSAFQNLLASFAERYNLQLIPENAIKLSSGRIIVPDGTIKNHLRLDQGWWESKDSKDDLDTEIESKINGSNYPSENIIFEDTLTAILIQDGVEVQRVSIHDDSQGLNTLLTRFFEYQRKPIRDFFEAIAKFQQDLPQILIVLRQLIETQTQNNPEFVESRIRFLEVCKEGISPDLDVSDIDEMIIQHILTSDIFVQIFYESEFHMQNSIARAISSVVTTFFVGDLKRNTFASIDHYYSVIRQRASEISDHHDKQQFLKEVYESFYSAYNPMAADRLGIVYTPGEVVRFMVESCDSILSQFFGSTLAAKNVKILDPCTGTGTFVTEIIEYLPTSSLAYKYPNDIYANEIGILPYYIASLNIEYTYQQKTGVYSEYKNLGLADTLSSCSRDGKQYNLLAMTTENTQVLLRQNAEDISVIIGNPPYNANQESENQSNRNRAYPDIDNQIRRTYLRLSSAKKTKLYDPYIRFIRWATDRLSPNGIIAFVCNSSFLHKNSFDGFRASVAEEFDYVYVLDLGGDIRTNPHLSGTKHNVFGIQTGVAILFMIRCSSPVKGAPSRGIYTSSFSEDETAKIKKEYLENTPFSSVPFECVNLRHPEPTTCILGDTHGMLPLISGSDSEDTNQGIFMNLSHGLFTSRDDWVYGNTARYVEEKVSRLIEKFNNTQSAIPVLPRPDRKLIDPAKIDNDISWSRSLKTYLHSSTGNRLSIDVTKIRKSIYRPFTFRYVYYDSRLNECRYRLECAYPSTYPNNPAIYLTVPGDQTSFSVLAIDCLPDFHLFGTSTQFAPRYWTDGVERRSNISQFAVSRFSEVAGTTVSEDDIFYYVYAILNCEQYVSFFKEVLTKELPRIPIFSSVLEWASLGRRLFDIHLHWESANSDMVSINHANVPESHQASHRIALSKDKSSVDYRGAPIIDNLPNTISRFVLGRRSALEWILDQAYPKKSRYAYINQAFLHQYSPRVPADIVADLKRIYEVSITTNAIRQDLALLWERDFAGD